MQTVRLHSNRIKNIIDFLKLFRPEQTNQGKRINLDGFVNAIGHNYSENNLLNGIFSEQDHLDRFYSLNDLVYALNNNKHLIGLGADVWFSPSLLLNKENIKASTSYVSWLTSLYVDIDGIKGVTDPQKALDKLYIACDNAGMKRPDIVNHTSTNPTVHLQAFWLIDPIYLKNNDKELNQNRVYWWECSQLAICEALKETDPDLNLDFSINDPSKYMRLPYTINQKTGEMVYILDKNITDRRNLLGDYWLKKLRKHYVYNKKRNKTYKKNTNNQSLLEHPQFKILLQGVQDYIRNYSHYALAKACLGDGLSLDKAQDKLLEMNSLCEPPEKERKVLDVVKRAYEDDKGISISIVSEVANIALGKDKFKPDPAILKLFNIGIGNCKSYKKISHKKEDVVYKVGYLIKNLKKSGLKTLPSQRELAKSLSIKYNSLKNYFTEIKTFLRKYGIYIAFDYEIQRYVFMTFSEWVYYVISTINNLKNDWFTGKKFSTAPLYIYPLYSIKGSPTLLQRARGSP